MAVLVGTDLFNVEVLRWRGWVTYYVLFFLPLETRRVTIAGIPGQPEEMWMEQMARNVTFAGEGCLNLSKGRDRLHDRDAKFGASFGETLAAGGVKSYGYRRAAKSECVRGALGTNGEARVPVEAHSVWGRSVTAGAARIGSAQPRGTQPPRQGQRCAIPICRGADDEARTIDPLSQAPRRSSQVLLPKGCMSFLTIRGLPRGLWGSAPILRVRKTSTKTPTKIAVRCRFLRTAPK
jgi:hypothetical protein